MVPIRGFNLDSKGSSGSGKTSIILAINYALGVCHLPATSLQSWMTEVPMAVELCLDTDEGEVVIARGEKFSVSIGGKVMRGSAKALEEKIQQIVGLQPELLEALTYRRQMTRGHFLSKTNSEKQEFLTMLLGLGKFESAIEKTQANIRDLEPGTKLLEDEVKRCEEDTEVRRKTVGNPDLLDEIPLRKAVDAIKEQILLLTEQIASKKQDIAHIESSIQKECDKVIQDNVPYLKSMEDSIKRLMAAPLPEVDRAEEERLDALLVSAKQYLQQAIEEDNKAKAAEQDHARALQGDLDQSRRDLDKIERLKESGRLKMAEITILESNVCPNCKQQWAQAQESKQRLEAEVEQIAIDLQEMFLEGIPSRVARLEKEVQVAWIHVPNPDIEKLRKIESQLGHEAADCEAHNASLEHDIVSSRKQEIAEAKVTLEAARSAALETARRLQGNSSVRLEGPQEELDGLTSALSGAQAKLQGTQNEAYQASMKNAAALASAETEVRLLKEAEQRLDASRKRFEVAAARLTAERDFLLLVGREGFLGSIFDEVLWEVSSETNRILGGIPNTAHVTISFRSETTTQKGKINKEIVPVAIINGHEAPIKAGCSGGMFSAVELAVDLAVSAVVSRRTGAVPSWIILDEAFEGLGVVEKEGCLEVLQSCAADKLMLIVDHASEIKEIGTQFIDVEYRDGISKMRCAIS